MGLGKKVSRWHDILLHSRDVVFNFVVEITKESSAKMEVATDEPFTRIKQDTKKANPLLSVIVVGRRCQWATILIMVVGGALIAGSLGIKTYYEVRRLRKIELIKKKET
ncbi:hypothetical protein CRG98_028398 [Punica granatum]|nr:hypothetical protein CRG98_028398 [Punica granatum]